MKPVIQDFLISKSIFLNKIREQKREELLQSITALEATHKKTSSDKIYRWLTVGRRELEDLETKQIFKNLKQKSWGNSPKAL